MKRDMELVRSILRDIAESEDGVSAEALADAEHPRALVAYHFEIMDEAGLIHATLKRAWDGQYVIATADSLTWEGNDLLAALSSEKVWTEVKRRVGKTLGDVSVSTLKALAVKVATDFLTT